LGVRISESWKLLLREKAEPTLWKCRRQRWGMLGPAS
jgi:hypothetical protein